MIKKQIYHLKSAKCVKDLFMEKKMETKLGKRKILFQKML